MHRRAALPSAVVLALALLATPLAQAHGWAPQPGYTRANHLVAQDCMDDWGVAHGLVDGHDLGAIYLREGTHAGEPALLMSIGLAGGYATEGATGPRSVEVTLRTPRVSTVITIATENNQDFTISGTEGVQPIVVRDRHPWLLDTGSTDSSARFGLELGFRYAQLRVQSGESVTGVGAQGYVGTTKADFLPGGYYTSAGSYVAECQGNATAGPDDRWFSRASFPIASSNWPPANVAPAANFTFSPASVRVNDTVRFTDTSADTDGTITTRSWDLGDGATSALQAPTHVYATPGARNVSLTVTDDGGLTATFSRVIDVLPALVRPEASFTATPENATVGQTIAFADASRAGDGALSAWAWEFGDGATSTQRNATHAYSVAGNYTARLVVTDANGLTAAAERVVHVRAPAGAPPAPSASFTISPDPAEAGAPVTFRDRSTSSGSAITSWSWTFGDGATSTQREPTHTYSQGGSYRVTLTVTTGAGTQAVATRSLLVRAVDLAPTALIAGDDEAVQGRAITFRDLSTDDGAIVARMWEFGDGATSTQAAPTHTYRAAGTYEVKLTVTDDGGRTATATREVAVREARDPVATIEAPGSAFVGDPVAFRDASAGTDAPLTGRTWRFPDGSTSTEAQVGRVFTDAGTYEITLEVRASDGRTATATHTLVVNGDPGVPGAVITKPTPTSAGDTAASTKPVPGPTIALVLAALALAARRR